MISNQSNSQKRINFDPELKQLRGQLKLTEKKRQVFELYQQYEKIVNSYKAQAVCTEGCASCCIEVGSVGATTLEGLIIQDYLHGLDRRAILEMNQNLKINQTEKVTRVFARCAFLDEWQSCRIYPVRPFSCRRLYSVRRCDGQGPVIHRRAVIAGQQIEKALQRLDLDGCSGHLSFVLHLLEKEPFHQAYLQGGWYPEEFRTMIQRYQLVVHRDRTSRA